MRLDTEIGAFVIHFHFPIDRGRRRPVVATLHRGPCVDRMTTGANELGLPCRADSPAVAEITNPKTRPFRRDRARAEALAKCMSRLGLNREERTVLWQAYFSQIHGPLARVCVAVETRCPVGHRHVVKAIHAGGWANPSPKTTMLFPSAREFCAAKTDAGTACEQRTIEAKHRYIYRAFLPEGKLALRRRQNAARLEGRLSERRRIAFTGDNTIP